MTSHKARLTMCPGCPRRPTIQTELHVYCGQSEGLKRSRIHRQRIREGPPRILSASLGRRRSEQGVPPFQSVARRHSGRLSIVLHVLEGERRGTLLSPEAKDASEAPFCHGDRARKLIQIAPKK